MKCPNIKTIGNDNYSRDYREPTERISGRMHPCLLESGDTCPEWEQIKKEAENGN